jgi:hypothetical protein
MSAARRCAGIAAGRRLLLVALVYSIPVVAATRPVTDADVWWHLRTGQWIVEHRAVPWIDPFSDAPTAVPWIAYSWVFEILIYGLYRAFGLAGIVLYNVAFAVITLMILHSLVRMFRRSFLVEIGLMAAATFTLFSVLAVPRSWLFSIVLFAATLRAVMAVKLERRTWPLFVLPPLFALCANAHVQFVYSVFLLGLFAAEPLVNRLFATQASPQPELPRRRWGLFIACLTATLIGPYHGYIYLPVIDAIRVPGPFAYLAELQAPSFRAFAHWLMLGLILAAAFVLGRDRRPAPFETGLFLAGAALSFRAYRDVWFVVFAAIVVLAGRVSPPSDDRFAVSWGQGIGIATALIALFAVVSGYRIGGARLERAIAAEYPAAAAQVVEARGYRGPLYNDYDWGGYLMWRLPWLRVAMDGRGQLHGDARVWRSIRTWDGEPGWSTDPELGRARLVIAATGKPLTSLLRGDPRFAVAYEDGVAVVFTRKAAAERATASTDGPS